MEEFNTLVGRENSDGSYDMWVADYHISFPAHSGRPTIDNAPAPSGLSGWPGVAVWFDLGVSDDPYEMDVDELVAMQEEDADRVMNIHCRKWIVRLRHGQKPTITPTDAEPRIGGGGLYT